MNKIRLIELFGGVGSQAMALRNIRADFETYRLIEFDKYAIASYNAIHKTNFPTMDITKTKGSDLGIVETDKYSYIMTYSFPCQDLSLAGRQAGMRKGSSTRSGLLWEVERLLNEVENLPQFLLMENVTQVHAEKNLNDFNNWLEFLQKKGYNSFYSDLNAKNYGVPQNRDRCFMVSILSDYSDKITGDFLFPSFFEFPEPVKLNKKISDLLEKQVDEKFYLTDAFLKYCLNDKSKFPRKDRFLDNINRKNQEIANAITTNAGNRPTDNFIKIPQATKEGSIKLKVGGVADLSYPDSKTRRGRVQEGGDVSPTLTATQQELIYFEGICAMRGRNPEKPNSRITGEPTKQMIELNKKGLCNTLTTVQKDNLAMFSNCRIRKLTPRECWRLMGFSDDDFDKASAVVSNTQLYKQAGNSIVVPVLEAIFREILKILK